TAGSSKGRGCLASCAWTLALPSQTTLPTSRTMPKRNPGRIAAILVNLDGKKPMKQKGEPLPERREGRSAGGYLPLEMRVVAGGWDFKAFPGREMTAASPRALGRGRGQVGGSAAGPGQDLDRVGAAGGPQCQTSGRLGTVPPQA